MGQITTTIRLDSDLKKRFDALCQQLGMTLNTAITVFVKTVVRTRSNPFKIEADDPSEQGLKALEALQAQAIANGVADMPLEEINAEIAAVRASKKFVDFISNY